MTSLADLRHLRLEIEPPLGRLTFNRPEKRNAMSPEMGDEVAEAVARINEQRDVRAMVVTGAGKVFSAGGDLDMILELTKISERESAAHMAAYYRKYFSLRDIAVPTIAMINGHAIGAGLCVALGCDLRTISADAKVGLTFVRLGLNVGMGGTYTLPRLIGLGPAAELLFTGELITAGRAAELGLVNRVCPREELEEETQKLARTIAANGPEALRQTKRSLYEGLAGDLDHVFECEAQGQSRCYQTQDIHEGVAAVRQKRSPEFRGE